MTKSNTVVVLIYVIKHQTLKSKKSGVFIINLDLL